MAERRWSLPFLVGAGIAYAGTAVVWLAGLRETREAMAGEGTGPLGDGGPFHLLLAVGTGFWTVLGLQQEKRSPGMILSYLAAGLHVLLLAARVVLGPVSWALRSLE